MTAIQPIDKKFLEEVVSDTVTDFTISPGCKVGDNVAGSLKAIAVTTKSSPDGKPNYHLIFKRLPELVTTETGFVVMMKVFWREHAIYKTVFSKLVEFAKARGLDYIAPIPKYYKGYNDDKHDYILMEDVRPSGYLMPDKTISLTFEETSLVMKEFAKFHAIGYAFLRHAGNQVFQHVDGFQYLEQDPAMVEMMNVQFKMMLRMFFTEAANVLEERYPEGAEKMRKYLENNWSTNFGGTMEHLTDHVLFPTLCHFDLWSNNMMIKHDKVTGKPVGVKFIDFQFTQRGNIFIDLHYTLYTSTTPEFRKAHLGTILNIYYDNFAKTLETMKVPLPWGFTRGFFVDMFHSGIGTAFIRMTFAIPLQLGQLTVTEKKDEAEQGIQELHTPENVRKMYSESSLAMERLEALVREMIELKVFQ